MDNNPPKQLPKLINMIIKRFPGLNRNQAWKLIVRVRESNGGVLRGLKLVNFFKIVARIVNEEKLTNKSNVKEKKNMSKTCPLCYKRFCNNQARDRHLKRMHTEPTLVEEEIDEWTRTEVADELDNLEQVDKERVECDQCGKQFVHLTSLKRHMKSHDQDKQSFVCEECKFVTNGLDSLVHLMHCVNLDLRNFTVKYVEENLALNMSFLKHILYRRLARQGMMHLMLMTKEGISVTYVSGLMHTRVTC